MIAQETENTEEKVIQFTGKVVTADEDGDIIPLPYVNVAVEGTSRGAVSEYDGYFSFVAKTGEEVSFSRIGFRTVNFTIPDTMENNFYSWIQIMSQDSILLDEVVIFPWPDRDYFKQEFLAIDISDELREQAEENLANEVMSEMRHSVPVDGKEASNVYLAQKAAEFKYSGQYKPQRIFDVMAWKQFIEAWKRGDYKRKKDKKN
jgi:hypothetical protein